MPVRYRLSMAVSSISHAVANALVTEEKCLSTKLAARPPEAHAIKAELGLKQTFEDEERRWDGGRVRHAHQLP